MFLHNYYCAASKNIYERDEEKEIWGADKVITEKYCYAVRSKKENVCVSVCERERISVCGRGREGVCLCVRERKRDEKRVSVCIKERERKCGLCAVNVSEVSSKECLLSHMPSLLEIDRSIDVLLSTDCA